METEKSLEEHIGSCDAYLCEKCNSRHSSKEDVKSHIQEKHKKNKNIDVFLLTQNEEDKDHILEQKLTNDELFDEKEEPDCTYTEDAFNLEK